MKRCICHHWIPPTECYVLGAPRIRWGGVREALGALGGWGHAPVNPHTKYMRIYGTAREREAKKKRQSNRRPASCGGSQVEPRPFLEISAQDQLRSKGTKKNSVMKVVNMRGELRGPFAPPSSSGTPTAPQSWCTCFWTALTILGWYAKEERT